MKVKRILAAVLATLMIISLAACGGGSSSTKGSVYWLNFKPELDSTLQQLAKKYTEAKKIDVKVVTPESGTYDTTLAQELNSNNPPTMFVLNNAQDVDKWHEYTADLKETSIAREIKSDEYSLYDDAGKLAAIGYCYECYGIIVNSDLLKMIGYKTEDIKNFDKLKEVVEYIHKNASWLGFDAFASTDFDAYNSWKYTAHLANLEYFYEERDMSGWDECPESIKGTYMDKYKNLYDLVINNSIAKPKDLNKGGHNAEEEFKSLGAAFYLNGSWSYSAVKDSIKNAVMIPYYCGMEGEEKAGLCCGTENYWAVNGKVSEEDRKATTDFMTWLVSNEEASAALVEQLGVMPFKNAAASKNGFLNNATTLSGLQYYVMDWAARYQPDKDNYRAELTEALKAYNEDQTDEKWNKVKTAFVDGWAKHYKAEHE